MKDKNYHVFQSDETEPNLPENLQYAKQGQGGFTVPASFFEDFERKINQCIDQSLPSTYDGSTQTTTSTPSRRLPFSRWWLALGTAAAAVLTFCIILQTRWLAHNAEDYGVENVTTIAEAAATLIDEDENSTMVAEATDYEIFEEYCDL